MNKGDVKATVIMVIPILLGVISGYYMEEHYPYPGKDGVGVIFGFVFGILFLLLLMAIWQLIRVIWQLIRLHIED